MLFSVLRILDNGANVSPFVLYQFHVVNLLAIAHNHSIPLCLIRSGRDLVRVGITCYTAKNQHNIY